MGIIASTAYLGYDSEQKITNELARLRSESFEEVPVAGEICFNIFFLAELALRILAHRMNFFFGKAWPSNLFDLILVMSSALEMGLSFSGKGVGINLSVFRIFRIFRLMRLLKVIRKVPVLESLNVMADGIINSFVPLMWALVLLLIIMYGFAVFFMSAVASYLVDREPDENVVLVTSLEDSYSSVYKVVMLLFEGVTGGRDWADLAVPLKNISELYHVCFGLYIVFVTLGVLNIITGFFVDGTIRVTTDAREDFIQAALEKKALATDMLSDVFGHMDKDGSGTLTLQELDESLCIEDVQRTFCALELATNEATELFNLLDYQGSGEVTIKNFIAGCLRLSGGSGNSNMDQATVLYQQRKVLAGIEVLLQRFGCAVQPRADVVNTNQAKGPTAAGVTVTLS
eukprot:NODE_6983_length_1619_cov_7.542895.p1 GENE.NODE_6983_length_1619_cov_7.542895~~NODE_6983_length_1619_cov_7.542895.p1  ORF type:complete len:401 (-),score=102.28 NODE_6983_length_1619_cov_7.542895:193-1395(-)